MARRIRSIKPEILDDGVTAALPHLEWRLFVSLWLLADDYGNLRGAVAQIKGAALWSVADNEAKTKGALDHLASVGLIRLYTAKGQPYVHICGWSKHQKVDHPGKASIPGPELADSDTCDASRNPLEDSRESRENLASDWIGRDGIGRDQEGEASPGLAIPDPPADLWTRQEAHRARNPKLRPLKFTPARRREVAARIREHGVESCEAVVDSYAAEAERTGDWQWFDGVTNWRAPNVERTLGRLGAQPRAGPSSPASSIDATAQALRDRGFLT
jgi:hypothetical protein